MAVLRVRGVGEKENEKRDCKREKSEGWADRDVFVLLGATAKRSPSVSKKSTS